MAVEPASIAATAAAAVALLPPAAAPVSRLPLPPPRLVRLALQRQSQGRPLLLSLRVSLWMVQPQRQRSMLGGGTVTSAAL